MSEGFEVIWSGEASVVGNQNTYSMWGHIKGPGPEDVVIFSTDNMLLRMENEISPQLAVPVISLVSNDGGVTPISPDSLIRTQETLTIIGTGLGGGTAIEIMSGDLVVQTIFPVDKYLVSDQRIDLPIGVVGFEAEGIARKVRVWNTVGVSDKSTHSFSVFTGPPRGHRHLA